MTQQQRGTVTDRLLNVIQVLQLGKKTGHLTVEREIDAKLEKGEVIFVQGQVAQAYEGNLRGQDALNWLSTWATCCYVFVPTTQEKVTDPLNKTSFTPPPPSRDKTTRSLPATKPSPDTRPHPATRPQQSTSTPVAGPSIVQTRTINRQRGSAPPVPVPHRTHPADDSLYILDRAKLSRAHRQLFLLIDGSRSIFELSRLTGRTPAEVQHLLRELEQIGVID